MNGIKGVLSKVGVLSPIQRVVLSNDGTNQLLLSAYFNSVVHISIKKQIETSNFIIRKSTLITNRNVIVCFAQTKIFKKNCSKDFLEMIRKKRMSIGNIIYLLDINVKKKIIDVGSNDNRFFRKYEIIGNNIRILLMEEFPTNLFQGGNS